MSISNTLQKAKNYLQPRLIVIALMLALAARWLADNLGELHRRAYLPGIPHKIPFLAGMYGEKTEMALALLLWLLAGLVFYLALGNKLEEAKAQGKLTYFGQGVRSSRLSTNRLAVALGLVLPGAVVLNVFLYQHHLKASLGWGDIALWLGAAVLLLLFFFLLDIAANRNFLHLGPLSRAETGWLVLLSALALRLYTLDINAWQYSFIGDEYSFYHFIQRLIKEGRIEKLNPFSATAVYGSHPAMASYYQALVARVFGAENAGWRLSSSLAAAACLLPFYIMLKSLFSRRTAVIGTCLLFASHYVIAYSHLGYDNNHVIFPLVLGLAALFWGIESGSLLGFALAGTACGWGFYTFYSSRLAVGIALIFFLLMFIDRLRPRHVIYLGVFLLAFSLCVAPLLMNSHGNFVLSVLKESALRSDLSGPQATGTALQALSQLKLEGDLRTLLLRNIGFSLLIPLHYQASGHFVQGQLLDFLSGLFCLLGMGYSLLWGLRRRDYLALNISYFVCLLAVGAVSYHAYPPVSRLFFMLPFLIAYAAIGMRGTLVALAPLLPAAALGRALLVTVVGLNFWHAYYRAPSRLAATPLALQVKLAQQDPARRIYMLESRRGICTQHALVKKIYGLDNFSRPYTLNPGWAKPKAFLFKPPALVTIWGEDNKEAALLTAILAREFPRGEMRVIHDGRRFRYLYYYSLEGYAADAKLSFSSDGPYRSLQTDIKMRVEVKAADPGETERAVKKRTLNYFYPGAEREAAAPPPLGLGDDLDPAALAAWLRSTPGVSDIVIEQPHQVMEVGEKVLLLPRNVKIELRYEE